ncbi:MAG: stage III sporulation protein AG [Clostridia bacterium]|nr:stage III sporulation protein AG [Clostridia bacterium]
MEKTIRIIRETIEKISEKSRLGKKLLLVVLLLASGIVLLLLSELIPAEKTASAQPAQTTLKTDMQEYSERLEQRLTSIISSIDGAGATKVMVTLESGSENVYLHDFDYGENADPSGKNSIERKDEYVIIDGSSGEQGIVVRTAEPRVRGVAVVCEGGGSEQVRSQIVEAVTALLDISSARVSVAKMN